MAKFIIEVSDGYIRERADVSNIQNSNEESSFAKMLVEFISFNTIKEKLDKGTDEFRISSMNLPDEKVREIFNNVVSQTAAIYIAISDKKVINKLKTD